MLQSLEIPNPENKPEVNHKYGDKKINRIYNLEWNTQSENQIHAIEIGLKKSIGENHPDAKFKNKEVLEIYNSNLPVEELSIKFKVPKHLIYNIKNGVTYNRLTKKQYEKKKGLSSDVVIEIFKSNLKPKELSEKYAIAISMVYRIKDGSRYSKITNKFKCYT
jgi:Golgi nucleoside diphosphatase